MEDFGFYQEKVRLRFEIRDITAQLDNPGDHEQNPTSVQQPVQFLVKFVRMFHYKLINTAIDRTETTAREYYDGTKERSCRFDVDKLKNYEDSFGIFTLMLSLIGVTRRQESTAKLIIKGGLKISNEVFHKGRQLLGLHVYVKNEYLRVRCEICTLEGGTRMMETTLEQLTNNDNSNKGIVPASYPAINKVLKRVRVGSTSADDEEYSSSRDDVEEEGRERKRRKIRVSESESCTVCLEQFKGGSTVVYMPCFHVFHGRCIVKWLRKSHYCPFADFNCLPILTKNFEVPNNSEQTNEVPAD